MPVMDGVTATSHILKSTPPDVRRPRIVALSASLEGGEGVDPKGASLFDRWLTKPVTSDAMQNMLDAMLSATGASR